MYKERLFKMDQKAIQEKMIADNMWAVSFTVIGLILVTSVWAISQGVL